MKFQDALIAGPEHGTDRLPVEIDRRMRRRLGLEASPRRVWLRPAMAAFAVAAAVVAVILFWPAQPGETPTRVAVGFVDISKAPWSGTVTGNEIDVRTDSPTSATVTWMNASIVAAPGTRMTTSPAGSLVLTQGAIQIQRAEAKPMFVEVPMGRVVIAAYRSSITADRESVTILLDDGTGHYVDTQGEIHPLVADVPLAHGCPARRHRQRFGREHSCGGARARERTHHRGSGSGFGAARTTRRAAGRDSSDGASRRPVHLQVRLRARSDVSQERARSIRLHGQRRRRRGVLVQ